MRRPGLRPAEPAARHSAALAWTRRTYSSVFGIRRHALKRSAARRRGVGQRVGASDPDVWVTVRTGSAPSDFSANLRAPILVADGRGHQVINEASDAPVRAPLFAGDVVEAAAHAGVERESFYRLLRRCGLSADDFRGSRSPSEESKN